jgi:hypothetical protein
MIKVILVLLGVQINGDKLQGDIGVLPFENMAQCEEAAIHLKKFTSLTSTVPIEVMRTLKCHTINPINLQPKKTA